MPSTRRVLQVKFTHSNTMRVKDKKPYTVSAVRLVANMRARDCFDRRGGCRGWRL